VVSKWCIREWIKRVNSLPNVKIPDWPKLKEFADENFIFDENWPKVLQTDRKNCGKRRNC
jgi:hypothetical protein